MFAGVTAERLITGAQGVAGDGIGKLATEHVVVDLAAISSPGIGTVKVTQVTGQCAGAQGQIVLDTGEVLAVEVFQFPVEIAEAYVLAKLVVGPGKTEIATLGA